MNALELLDSIRRAWWVVLLCLIAGIASATALTLVTPKQYSSTASLLVAAVPAGDTTTFQAVSIVTERVKSFTGVPTSTPVVDDVIDRLGLSVNRVELISNIKVTVPADTSVVRISVTNGNPETSAKIANTLGELFARRLATIDPSGMTFGVSVIEPASPSTQPVTPRPSLNLAIGTLLGGMTGVVAAALRRRRLGVLSSAAAVERVSGSTVFAEIADPGEVAMMDALVQGSATRSETFRKLRLALAHGKNASAEGISEVCLVCGDQPGAGSAWVASQLALAGSAVGGRVLLVDLARSPEGAGQDLGLVDLLLQRAPLDEVLTSLPTGAGVTLMGWGQPDAQVVDPLGSAAVGQVVTALAGRFDSLVVLTRDVTSSSDAALLGEHVSDVLLVVRSETATSGVVGDAAEALVRAAGALSGVVLTTRPHQTAPHPSGHRAVR